MSPARPPFLHFIPGSRNAFSVISEQLSKSRTDNCSLITGSGATIKRESLLQENHATRRIL